MRKIVVPTTPLIMVKDTRTVSILKDTGSTIVKNTDCKASNAETRRTTNISLLAVSNNFNPETHLGIFSGLLDATAYNIASDKNCSVLSHIFENVSNVYGGTVAALCDCAIVNYLSMSIPCSISTTISNSKRIAFITVTVGEDDDAIKIILKVNGKIVSKYIGFNVDDVFEIEIRQVNNGRA